MPDHNESITEIIEKTPPWLMRYGIMSLFFLLLLLVYISTIVKYPDSVLSKVEITTKIPPIEVVSTIQGQIQKKLVTESSIVKKGQWIFYMNQTVDLDNIQSLEVVLDTVLGKTYHIDSICARPIKYYGNLGELQIYFNQLYQFQESIRSHQQIKAYQKRTNNVSKQIQYQKRQRSSINQHYQLNVEELKLLEININRNRQLYAKGVISKHDLEVEERNYLRKKIELNQSQQNIENIKLNINTTIGNRTDLTLNEQEIRMRFVQDYNAALNELKSKLDIWIAHNVIISPIDGQVAFYNPIDEGEFIQNGQKLLIVVPKQNNEIIGRGVFPIENSGKVKLGCKVNLKLDAYSFKEYGIVDGVIANISKVPLDGGYRFTVRLPNQLTTKYENRIDFRQKTTAQGEIITEDLSLFQRVLYQFKDLYKN